MSPARKMRPVHPGEFLREEFLLPLNITVSAAARALGMHRQRLSLIVNEEACPTPVEAIRLSLWLGTSVEVWTNLSSAYVADEAKVEHLALLRKQIRPLPKHADGSLRLG